MPYKLVYTILTFTYNIGKKYIFFQVKDDLRSKLNLPKNAGIAELADEFHKTDRLDAKSMAEFIASADRKLYQAKREGRNKVC